MSNIATPLLVGLFVLTMTVGMAHQVATGQFVPTSALLEQVAR